MQQHSSRFRQKGDHFIFFIYEVSCSRRSRVENIYIVSSCKVVFSSSPFGAVSRMVCFATAERFVVIAKKVVDFFFFVRLREFRKTKRACNDIMLCAHFDSRKPGSSESSCFRFRGSSEVCTTAMFVVDTHVGETVILCFAAEQRAYACCCARGWNGLLSSPCLYSRAERAHVHGWL